MPRRREKLTPTRGALVPRRPALTAAAETVDLRDKEAAKRSAARRQEWQTDAWLFFDEITEVKFGVTYRGACMSKLRLFVAAYPVSPEHPDGDPTAEPVPVTDERAGIDPQLAVDAVAELDRLQAPVGGQGEILRSLDMNLEVPGECYVVGRSERPPVVDPISRVVKRPARPEEWDVRSISEIRLGPGGDYELVDDPGARGEKLDPELDTVFRIWQRHPQWRNRADSPMRGVMNDCEVLLALLRQQLAEANSRMSAGLLTMPEELTFSIPENEQKGDGDTQPADEAFVDRLMRLLVRPVEDPSDPASLVPGVIEGPGALLGPDFIRRIDLSRESQKTLDDRIEARVERILRGLNLPIEKVKGHANTTFANAAQIDDDEWEDYHQNRADFLVQALTIGFLRPQLMSPRDGAASDNGQAPQPGHDPLQVRRVFVWYDASELRGSPDLAAGADGAWDRMTISDAAYRKAKGYSDDDAPDDTERQRRLDEAASMRGPTLGQLLDSRLPVARANGHRRVIASSAREVRHFAQSRRLMEIDRDLRTRLVTESNALLNRALERAGHRLLNRTKSLGAAAQGVTDPRLVAAHIGPSLVAQVGGDPDELLAGAFDQLETQFMAWGANAQTEALDVASRIAGGFSRAQREVLQLRQAQDLTEAWSWMHGSLTSLAHARLFNPDPAAPDVGEFDPTSRVPTGLVRQALGRAGGATGIITTGSGDTFVALAQGGSEPIGGIATGEAISGALAEEGVTSDGFQWDYGPGMRSRPFEPHVELDGVTFDNFDADVLVNPDSFPETEFFMPGDHDGCLCDVIPLY